MRKTSILGGDVAFVDIYRYFCASFQPTPEITLQDRLERIWNQLKMPDSLRLDMAIKYSSDDYSDKFAEVLKILRTFISQTRFTPPLEFTRPPAPMNLSFKLRTVDIAG